MRKECSHIQVPSRLEVKWEEPPTIPPKRRGRRGGVARQKEYTHYIYILSFKTTERKKYVLTKGKGKLSTPPPPSFFTTFLTVFHVKYLTIDIFAQLYFVCMSVSAVADYSIKP